MIDGKGKEEGSSHCRREGYSRGVEESECQRGGKGRQHIRGVEEASSMEVEGVAVTNVKAVSRVLMTLVTVPLPET